MGMTSTIRNDWTRAEIAALFELPFNDLMFQAQVVHRENFDPNEVQISTLCSIKTGACPEDCKYCPQSARYDTGLEKERLMKVEAVLEEARAAKASGALVSVWAQLGARRRKKTCLTSPKWSKM